MPPSLYKHTLPNDSGAPPYPITIAGEIAFKANKLSTGRDLISVNVKMEAHTAVNK